MSCYLDSMVKAPLSKYRMQNILKSRPLVNVLLLWLIICPQSWGELKHMYIFNIRRYSFVHPSSSVLAKSTNSKGKSTRTM